MHRVGFLFDRMVVSDNLWAAWREFATGKRRRPAVLAFSFDVVRRLVRLQRDLSAGNYEPQPHRWFLLHEPKRRLISVAPVRDRVVHHALHRVLAPHLDPGLTDHCFACLPGRGVQRAVLRFQRAMRRHPFVLLLDIRAYFPSIVPEVVVDLLEHRVKDRRVLAVCRQILEQGRGHYDSPRLRSLLGIDGAWPPRGRGVPIGNLTSQWWGNHYLAELDHLCLRTLRSISGGACPGLALNRCRKPGRGCSYGSGRRCGRRIRTSWRGRWRPIVGRWDWVVSETWQRRR